MGRPQFAQVGSKGSGQKVAVSDKPEIQAISADITTDVVAGDMAVTDVYAPTGSVYRLLGAYLKASAIGSATSGSHEIRTYNSQDYNIVVLLGESDYNQNVVWNVSYWNKASIGAQPPNDAAALEALQSMRATENEPIRIEYRNNTDADQPALIRMKLIVEELSY